MVITPPPGRAPKSDLIWTKMVQVFVVHNFEESEECAETICLILENQFSLNQPLGGFSL